MVVVGMISTQTRRKSFLVVVVGYMSSCQISLIHGLCRDLDNNIYFTFVPKTVTNTTQVLVRFSPDGSDATLLGQPGPEGLAAGVPHGLRFEYDAKANQSFLYHSNNAALVIKTTLEGKLVWKADLSDWNRTHPHFWPIRPTQAVVVPGTDILLVADGYGSSWVHAFNKTTGEFLENQSFGGKGNGTDPVQFNTPHGIKDDPRVPGSFVISDRTNNRLVWVTATGKFLKAEVTSAVPGMSLPCNVDVHEDKQAGNVSITPSLGKSYNNLTEGSAAIYASNGTVLSIIEVAKHIGHLGHQHPHDAIFLPNGDIVICCWSGPGTPGMGPAKGTISYWRRMLEKKSMNVEAEQAIV